MSPARRGPRGSPALEGITVSLLLSALMAATFGPYLSDGGLTSDDWAIAELQREHGYLGAVDRGFGVLGSKPLLAILLPLPRTLFGAHVAPQLALALVLGIVTAAAFYAALRHLTLDPQEAVLMAGLLVLFPWSDSMRLWVTGSLNQVSLILYMTGLVLALRGLRKQGRRAIVRHAGAVLLYTAAVLTYEAIGALALLTGALYLGFSEPRRALSRWAADAVGVGAAIAYSAATTAKGIQPLSAQLENAVDMGRGAAALAANALVPVDVPHEIVGVCALALLVGAVAVAWREVRDVELRRWLKVVAVATAAVAAGYAMFVPGAYWTPQLPNLENRVNLVAALGLVVVTYGLLRIAAVLVLRPWPALAGRAPVLAMLAVVAVGVGYAAHVRHDRALWARAAAEQRAVLAAVREAVPNPRSGDRIFTFGHRAQVAKRLPVFFDSFDLWAAVKLEYRDASLSAYPVIAAARFACGDRTLRPLTLPSPTNNGPVDPIRNGEPRSARYGHVWFVDTARARAERIDDRRHCQRAIARFRPGPVQ